MLNTCENLFDERNAMIFQTCYVNECSTLLEPGTADKPIGYSVSLGEGIYIPKTDWEKFGIWDKLIEKYGNISNIPNHWEFRKKMKQY